MPGVREWVQLLLLSHFSAHAASPMVSFASMITWLLQPRLTQKKRGLQLPQDPLSTLPIWRFSGHSCVVISLTAEINTSNREQKPLCEICLEKNTSLFCQGKYSACDWFSSVAELCAVFYLRHQLSSQCATFALSEQTLRCFNPSHQLQRPQTYSGWWQFSPIS